MPTIRKIRFGRLQIQIKYENQKSDEEVLICDNDKNDLLLSYQWCKKLCMISKDFPKPIAI